jgi:hypothetical protein
MTEISSPVQQDSENRSFQQDDFKKTRLRPGPLAIDTWAAGNTWAPRVAKMYRDKQDQSLCVTVASSSVSKNNVRFPGDPLSSTAYHKPIPAGRFKKTPIRLVKFAHAPGSTVYSDLFNTYEI